MSHFISVYHISNLRRKLLLQANIIATKLPHSLHRSRVATVAAPALAAGILSCSQEKMCVSRSWCNVNILHRPQTYDHTDSRVVFAAIFRWAHYLKLCLTGAGFVPFIRPFHSVPKDWATLPVPSSSPKYLIPADRMRAVSLIRDSVWIFVKQGREGTCGG